LMTKYLEVSLCTSRCADPKAPLPILPISLCEQ
jgi:hypothetical protein